MKRQKNKIQQIDFTDKTKSFHAFPPHFQRRSHGKHKKLTFPSIRYELPGFITILAKSKHILMKALLLTGREYLLNEKGEWEQFTVIGKQVVTIGELERLLLAMKQKEIGRAHV